MFSMPDEPAPIRPVTGSEPNGCGRVFLVEMVKGKPGPADNAVDGSGLPASKDQME